MDPAFFPEQAGLFMAGAAITAVAFAGIDRLRRIRDNNAEEKHVIEHRYHALLDHCSDAVLVVSSQDFAVIEANPAARQMIGPIDGTLPKLTDLCQIALPEGAPIPVAPHEWFALIQRHRRLSLVRHDGSSLPLEADATAIQMRGRLCYQICLREVTDRSVLKQQLRQADKLSTLGQMVCSIAHELCNPLAVVIGYVDLLLERKDVDPGVATHLAKVRQEADRASRLVKTFLGYAHQRPAVRAALDLNEAVERALEIRALELRDACAETTLKLERNLPLTIADFDQIQQILVNLIHNSMQAIAPTGKTPRIKITTYALDEKVVLKLEDNGPGIPRELLHRVFEPFFTTKPSGVGTGLGLSIAHSIMAEHKGRIYYSAPPEGGAGFILEFPRAADEIQPAPDAEEIPAPQPAQQPTPARVLILDDQEAIAEVLAHMVRLSGYDAVTETAPASALERIEREHFDLILSDFRMPEMNGQEFFNASVAIRPQLANRVIFLTGDLLNDETQQFFKTSGAPYIPKPFHLNKIQKALAEALSCEAAS